MPCIPACFAGRGCKTPLALNPPGFKKRAPIYVWWICQPLSGPSDDSEYNLNMTTDRRAHVRTIPQPLHTTTPQHDDGPPCTRPPPSPHVRHLVIGAWPCHLHHTIVRLFTPLHIASHRITPLHTSSHRITSHHTSSHLFTPLHTSSHRMTYFVQWLQLPGVFCHRVCRCSMTS